MKSILTLLFLTVFVNAVEAQLPKVSAGSIQRFENLPSRFVAARNVDVWLPDGYSPKKRYAVLYMHDGNSLFDSSIMWNHQEWGVDETVSKLLSEQKIKDVIVVGAWNSGASRHAEYFPQKPFETLSEIQKEFVTKQLQEKGRTIGPFKPISDNYLKFLVQELKPFVDSVFSTKKDPKNTFIAGSSMGGLISMYAICEYPNIFGGAICISTHWPGIHSMNENPVPTAFFNYLKNNLPNPNSHKIYFDYGDQTLDAMYPPLQKQVDAVMVAKGYTNKNWITRFFPGENHSEASWSKRLDIPLLFLLKK
jgi:predicted alpha/beta superfamily hydrolase